jgi:exodeoxyribonuclease VII small subunit
MSEMKNDMSFEEMLGKLEDIVRKLDSVETPLDTSLALFEEGAKLVRLCTKKLDDAQQKVTMLTLGGDGVTEEPFRAQKG